MNKPKKFIDFIITQKCSYTCEYCSQSKKENKEQQDANKKTIDSPKSFQVACIVTSQIIATVASNQYGGQSVDLIHLGKYARKSYNKFKKNLEEKYKGKIADDIIDNVKKPLWQNYMQKEMQNETQKTFMYNFKRAYVVHWYIRCWMWWPWHRH